MKPAQVRKFLVAAVAALSQALALGMLPSPYDKYVMCALSVAAAYGVYKVPNKEKAPVAE